MQDILNKSNKFHFIGIGGYGMSALAKILLEEGYLVGGSDIKKSPITEKLERLGAEFYNGHNERNVGEADVVVYSACIKATNPELIIARKKNIPVLHRAELLAELMNDKIGVAVSGTHGKTTTTTLISLIFKYCGLDPTVVIGGQVDNLGDGAIAGKGDFVIAEADESDGSFLFLRPTYSVITNIDLEHLDYYKNIGDIKRSYFQFMERTKGDGKLFYCGDDGYLQEISKIYRKKMMSFGFFCNNDIYPANINFEGLSLEFEVMLKRGNLGRVRINAAGEHNIINCLAAVAVALEAGIEFKKIKEAFSFFHLPKRRCQIKANVRNIMVIDDYAHHPTEIKTTIKGIRNVKPKRMIVVFQPHRYSRTKCLEDLFINSFDAADYLIMTDIYSAAEAPIEDISGERLMEKIKAQGRVDGCFLPKGKIISYLLDMAKEGDVILFMGAGDVTEIANEFSNQLKLKVEV